MNYKFNSKIIDSEEGRNFIIKVVDFFVNTVIEETEHKMSIASEREKEIAIRYYKNYKFYLKNNFTYPLSSDEKDLITLKFNLEKIRKIKNNISIGNVEVYLGDSKIHTEKIYVEKKEKKKPSFIDKIKGLKYGK